MFPADFVSLTVYFVTENKDKHRATEEVVCEWQMVG